MKRIGIIGAGLAGASCARVLARAGFKVTLLESGGGPARGASGNPVGILHPLISKDFNLASQWIEQGIQTSLRWLSELNSLAEAKDLGVVGQTCGVLQMNQDCSELVNWSSNGAWIRPARWVEACLSDARQHGAKISHGAKVLRVDLQPQAQVDVMLGGDESKILNYKFDAVVFCNGAAMGSLLPNAQLRLNSIRGRISSYQLDPKYSLPQIICAQGYATPVIDGEMVVGASYERLSSSSVSDCAGDSDDRLSEEFDPRSNLDRLRVISESLAERCAELEPTDRTSIRSATLDRMPHVGRLLDDSVALIPSISRIEQMPRSERLWVLGGLGSRGLSTAALGAEMILAYMTGRDLPVSARLALAVDPVRFSLRRHQRRKIG